MGPGRPGGRYIDAPIIVAVKKNSREGYLEIPLREGTLDIVNRLLQDERVDPSVSNNMPIRFASCYNNLALVDRLLQDERVDPSVNNNEALHSARARELTAIVDRLMMDRRVMLANMVD
jgi:hypothetical protein